MIRTCAPSLVLVMCALLLTVGVPPSAIGIPFVILLTAALAIYVLEARVQIRSERRSGRERRRYSRQ